MPLSGVRIVDLSRLAPGPYATRLLAEMGAEIIKVEAPGGDLTRWTPPLAGEPATGGVFRELNPGKKSVLLNLKSKEGLVALEHLVKRCDVLVDGFRPGVLARLGLDPRRLMEEDPRLIYCAITGYGLTGPDAQRAGHDVGYLGRAGVLDLCGPPAAPVTLGVQVADIGAGMVAVGGICAALYAREKTGRGQVVDVSLAESGLAFNALNFGNMHAGDEIRRGKEILDGSRPCYSVYETKDGRHLAVGALEPKFWAAFITTLELPDLISCGLDSGEQGEGVKAQVQAKLHEKTLAEWTEIFRTVDCCVEPILHPEEAVTDAHFQSRHMVVDDVVRSPIRVTDWSNVGGAPKPLAPAPSLGGNTREVLEAAGVPSEVIDALE